MDEYTQSEVDALDTLMDSPGWELVKLRIMALIGRDQRELEREIPEIRTHRIRGALTAYRVMYDLPGTMRGEIVEQLKGAEAAVENQGRQT